MAMSDKRTILLQLDTDPQPSVFDHVVAVADQGVDEVRADEARPSGNDRAHDGLS